MSNNTSSVEDYSNKCVISHSDLETVPSTAPEAFYTSFKPLPSENNRSSATDYSEDSVGGTLELAGTKLEPTWREGLRRRRKQLWIGGAVFLVVLATSIALAVHFSAQNHPSSDNKSKSSSPLSVAPNTANVIGLAAVWDGMHNRTTVIHRSLSGEFTQTDCKLSSRLNATERNICNTTELSYIHDARVDTPLAAIGTVGNFTLLYFSKADNNSIRATNPLTQHSYTAASNLPLHSASKLGVASADPVADPLAATFNIYYQDRDNAIQELAAGASAATSIYANASEGTYIAAMAIALGRPGTTQTPSHSIMFLRPDDEQPGKHLVSRRLRTSPRMAYFNGKPQVVRVNDPETALACAIMKNRRKDDKPTSRSKNEVGNESTLCLIPNPDTREVWELLNMAQGYWHRTSTLPGALLVSDVTSPIAAGLWYSLPDTPPDTFSGWQIYQVLFDTPQKDDAVESRASRGYIGQKFYNPSTKWGDGPGIPLN